MFLPCSPQSHGTCSFQATSFHFFSSTILFFILKVVFQKFKKTVHFHHGDQYAPSHLAFGGELLWSITEPMVDNSVRGTRGSSHACPGHGGRARMNLVLL